MHNILDLTGHVYGRLTVIKEMPIPADAKDFRNRRWLCLCECGNEYVARQSNIRCGNTKSCGCLEKEVNRRHHMRGTSEYHCWRGVVQRCCNPNAQAYDEYGGRGVTMHQEWRDSFDAFIRDIGPKPSVEHSLDRINVNGNYEPGNVRWALPDTQAFNKRTSIRHEYNGVMYTSRELAELAGITYTCLRNRLASGMSAKDAVEKPQTRSWVRREGGVTFQKTNILNQSDGNRELDVWIGENLFEFTITKLDGRKGANNGVLYMARIAKRRFELPAFSSNIQSAWIVVEEMKSRGCDFILLFSNNQWSCEISKNGANSLVSDEKDCMCICECAKNAINSAVIK